MAELTLLNRADFSKEIIERTYNASSIITEFSTVFQVLRTAKKLPLDKKAQQDFLAITGKYDLNFVITKKEALRLVDLINTMIKLKDGIDESSKFKAGDILKDYQNMFAKETSITRQQQNIRKKEVVELLKVIGRANEAKKILSANDKDIHKLLGQIASKKAIQTRDIEYNSLNQIQKIIQQQDQNLLSRIKRTPTTLKDTIKTGGLKKALGMNLSKIGGGALELALNLGGSTRKDMADMFKDLRGGKDSTRQQLRDLQEQEALRREQEKTNEYLKQLSDNLNPDKKPKLEQTEEEKEYQQESLETLQDTQKTTQDGFYQLVDKSRDMINGVDRVADKIEDTTQEIRKLSNQFKFLSDDLRKLNKSNKDKNNDDDTSLLEDLSDMFDMDRKGKKGKKGRKRKSKRHRKGKRPKTPKSFKAGKLGKLGNIATSSFGKMGTGAANLGTKALGGLAKFAGPIGLALTAGMALTDAYDGFDKDKANALGFDGDTVKGKANSSLASVGSGLTFGLVDESTVAEGIKFKDKVDDKVVDALGGKDSILGKVANSVLNPFDNTMDTFDKIGDWFSDKKKEDEEKANELGFDGKTTKGKANSSISSVASGLTFGLVDESTVAEGLKLKDKVDDAIISAVGGKDSILGKVANSVLNPFDNTMDTFDKIGDWFSDKKKEEKTKSDKEELTDAQKAVKGIDPTLATTAGAVATNQLPKYNNLDSAFNTDELDPLANGFQNMFDYMSQIPGIGEFFKDKSSGKVDSATANKALEMFNPSTSILSGFRSAISSIFSLKGNSVPSNQAQSYSGGYQSLPMPQVSNKDIKGTGAAKQARDAYIEIAKKNGRSSQDIQFALANMARETGGFTKSAGENMNYSSVERIMQVHGAKIRKWGGDVNTLVKNPEALANVVYSDHNGSSLGNTEQGDGWRYRGRGLVQLTGRSNYRKYGKILGIDLEGNPDLASDPQVAAQVADAYLKERSYGKDFNSFSAGIIGNVKDNAHGIAALEKGRSYLNAAGAMVDGVASPIQAPDNQQQAQSATPSGQLRGMIENIKGTKVNESQKQALQSGRLKLQMGFKAQGMNGYNPNQQYFQAPKGRISKNDVTKLDPQLYQNLNMMAHEYQATTGNKFIVTNSFRTKEEQAALKAAGYKANKPGYSLHEYGLAVDIQPAQAQQLEKMGLLKKYGFYRPLPNDSMEKQHVQPLSIAKSSLAGAGDTQVPDKIEDTSSESNPIPPPIVQPKSESTNTQIAQNTLSNINDNAPNSTATGISTLNPINGIGEDKVPAMSVSGTFGSISDIATNSIKGLGGQLANKLTGIVTNLPQLVTQTPTAKEQVKIQTEQQKAIAKQTQSIIQNNINNNTSSLGQGQSVDRGEYFDDIIQDVGLTMFNRMQLG